MLLAGKNAIIYGASPSLGGAVAKAFAKEGAMVWLTGLDVNKVKPIADAIIAEGGQARVDVVDALDQHAVQHHIDRIVAEGNSIDISFNLIDTKATQNIPLVDMKLEDFLRPVEISMKTQFITNTAAARQMIRQRSGVILTLTATPGGVGYPMVGGFGPACCAMESLSRDLGSELGPYGIRVVNIRSGGSPDSRPFKEAIANSKGDLPDFLQKMKDDTMLKELPMMKDIANAAVFLSSDMASMITGVTIDITSGATTALSYKAPVVPLGD